MRPLAYLRVSTDEQADSGLGLAAQRAAISAECERRGWDAPTFVSDEGFTASNMKRPALLGALEQLDNGDYTTMICAKLDRLSRSLLDFAQTMKRAQENGWSVVLLDLAVDTSTPAGEAMANVMATFAQYEARLISERTKAALAAKKAQGFTLGRPPETPQQAIDRIQALRAAGLSYAATAARLTAENIPTARGGKWAGETVRVVERRLV